MMARCKFCTATTILDDTGRCVDCYDASISGDGGTNSRQITTVAREDKKRKITFIKHQDYLKWRASNPDYERKRYQANKEKYHEDYIRKRDEKLISLNPITPAPDAGRQEG